MNLSGPYNGKQFDASFKVQNEHSLKREKSIFVPISTTEDEASWPLRQHKKTFGITFRTKNDINIFSYMGSEFRFLLKRARKFDAGFRSVEEVHENSSMKKGTKIRFFPKCIEDNKYLRRRVRFFVHSRTKLLLFRCLNERENDTSLPPKVVSLIITKWNTRFAHFISQENLSGSWAVGGP